MNILGIAGTPRKGGNSEHLLHAALEPFFEAGWDVTKILLSEMKIEPCTGCEICVESGRCSIDDDMSKIYEAFEKCNAIIISSPTYYRNVPAQLKAVIDRTFAVKGLLKGKLGGVISVGRGTSGGGQCIVLTIVNNYYLSSGMLCVPGELNGVVATAYKPGDILEQPRRLEQARVLGYNILGYAKMLVPPGLDAVAREILEITPKPLILVDGKGGSGKTTFAKKLADVLGADIVHSDDVAWWADVVQWDGEMLEGIIRPWISGENVSYKPSGWIKKNRDGHINVDATKSLIIEGCGACRKTLRKVADYSIWVDTDPDISRERVIKRDLANGENGATIESVTEFTDWFDSIIDPFLAEEEAWKYVNAIVSGMHSNLRQKEIIYGITKNKG